MPIVPAVCRRRPGAGVSRDAALLGHGDRLPATSPVVHPRAGGVLRVPPGGPLHRRCVGRAGGDPGLRRRAHPPGDRPAHRGPARGDLPAGHDQFPDPGRHQGVAGRAGRPRPRGDRFRHPARARARGGRAGGAGRLHRRLRRHVEHGRRAPCGHPHLRHAGALLDHGVRGRGRELPPLRRGVPRLGGAADRHLRRGGRRSPRSRTGTGCPRGAHRQRRSARRERPGPPDPGRAGADRHEDHGQLRPQRVHHR